MGGKKKEKGSVGGKEGGKERVEKRERGVGRERSLWRFIVTAI